MNGDRMIQSEAVVSRVRFLSGGRLAGACADGKVRVWEARSSRLTKVVAQDAGDVAPLVLDDAEACAAVGSDGAVKLRDLRTGAIVRSQSGPSTKVKRLAASHDGKVIAGFGPAAERANDWTARLWDRTGKQRFAVPCGFGEVWATAISPDGATLATGSWDTDIRIWSTGSGVLVARIEEVTVSMFAMDFSPDGKVLAAAGADRSIYFLDTKTWKVTRKLTGQNDVIVSIAFSSMRRASTTQANSIRRWSPSPSAAMRGTRLIPRCRNSSACRPDSFRREYTNLPTMFLGPLRSGRRQACSSPAKWLAPPVLHLPSCPLRSCRR